MIDPDEFTRMWNEGVTVPALVRHFGCSKQTIAYHRYKLRLTPRTSVERPIPEDFAELARTMGTNALELHYRAGSSTIAKWRRITGVRREALPKPPKQPRQPKAKAEPKPKRRILPAAQRRLWGSAHEAPPDGSRAGQAAQFLRRTYSQVYHRIIHGKQFRGEWQVGRQIMSTAAMIAHAEERGWRPDAWRAVA